MPNPVRWSATSPVQRQMQPGGRYSVLLHAAIDPGWHLYALQQPDAFPLATEVALTKDDSAELLRVEQEKPRRGVDPESHVVTNYFQTSATFTLRLRPTSTSGKQARELHILVRYQACNDRLCLPPKDTVVPVTFTTAR